MTARARLVSEIPRVLEWWQRIQSLLRKRLIVNEAEENVAAVKASAFRCCLGGVNPLDVEVTSQWLESDGIKEEFEKQVEATGRFHGIQSRPAGPGKKKRDRVMISVHRENIVQESNRPNRCSCGGS